MKISCGTDIIEISRIKDAIERGSKKFVSEIFTPEEIAYCQSKHNAKYQHYAARFAAKEAVFKAISPLLKEKFEITWKQAQIENDEKGKPFVVFHDVSFERRIISIDISISHCQSYAVANVSILYE